MSGPGVEYSKSKFIDILTRRLWPETTPKLGRKMRKTRIRVIHNLDLDKSNLKGGWCTVFRVLGHVGRMFSSKIPLFFLIGGRIVYPKLSHNATPALLLIQTSTPPKNQIKSVIDVCPISSCWLFLLTLWTWPPGEAPQRNSDRRLDLKLKYLDDHGKPWSGTEVWSFEGPNSTRNGER